MAARTYIPQLRLVLQVVKHYANRWQVKLQENLTPTQYNCLIAVIEAIDACLIALGDAPINP
jgi:hypothetical protein